jgi:hypothetical protein
MQTILRGLELKILNFDSSFNNQVVINSFLLILFIYFRIDQQLYVLFQI